MVLDDFEDALQDHHQVIRLVAIGKQHVTGRHLLLDAVASQNLQLNPGEDRSTARLLRRERGAGSGGGSHERPLVITATTPSTTEITCPYVPE
jgi:hypothetical protein